MPCAVAKIEPRLPKRGSRQRVDLRSARPFREYGSRNGDMPFQHAREPVTDEPHRPSDRDCPGDVGRPVLSGRRCRREKPRVLFFGLRPC